MKNRIILHIDFDSFFASCEQQFNPQFRGKPLGVTAHNGRTAIIAASREAKARGVKSPSRTFDAYQVCPELLLTTSHFVEYWEISKKFLHICRDYSPFIELFSLDEVFIDVTQTSHLFGGVYSIIQRIKDRIKNEIGEYITVSFGISHNKTLAKLASGLHKPNGLVEIKKKDVEKVYAQVPLQAICGIGERIRLRLNKIGIYTLLHLRAAPLPMLLAEFGNIEGHFLHNVGLGIDNAPIVPYTEAPGVKSIGRNYCLPQNEYNHRVVLQNLYELGEEVAIKLRRLNKKAKTVGLSLRGSIEIHGQKTDAYYFDSGRDVFEIGLTILQEFCHPRSHEIADRVFNHDSQKMRFYRSVITALQNDNRNYIRQISVWVSNLQDKQHTSLRMFGSELKWEKLWKTVDNLNDKYGNHTIRNGFLLYADKLTTVPNGYMADTYERTRLAEEAMNE